MVLPRSLTTVTPFSKFLALLFFILLPFMGFFFGMAYQQKISSLPEATSPAQYSNPSPTPTPTLTLTPAQIKQSTTSTKLKSSNP